MLTNYITAAGFPTLRVKIQVCRRLHVIGKDVVPRFGRSDRPRQRPPFSLRIFVGPGEKMSKSVGFRPISRATPSGVVTLPAFCANAFGQDGNCSHEVIVNRINADLAKSGVISASSMIVIS